MGTVGVYLAQTCLLLFVVSALAPALQPSTSYWLDVMRTSISVWVMLYIVELVMSRMEVWLVANSNRRFADIHLGIVASFLISHLWEDMLNHLSSAKIQI